MFAQKWPTQALLCTVSASAKDTAPVECPDFPGTSAGWQLSLLQVQDTVVPHAQWGTKAHFVQSNQRSSSWQRVRGCQGQEAVNAHSRVQGRAAASWQQLVNNQNRGKALLQWAPCASFPPCAQWLWAERAEVVGHGPLMKWWPQAPPATAPSTWDVWGRCSAIGIPAAPGHCPGCHRANSPGCCVPQPTRGPLSWRGACGERGMSNNTFSGPELPWLVQKTLKANLARPWEIRAHWRHQESRVMLGEGFLTVLPFTGSPNTCKMSFYSTTTLVGSCTVNE